MLKSRACVGEGDGTLLQYSCLESPMNGGPWWATVHGVTKSRTRLSDFTVTFHFHALEKEMAVFLPGESQARGSLVGCRLWGCTESDTTEATAAAAALDTLLTLMNIQNPGCFIFFVVIINGIFSSTHFTK